MGADTNFPAVTDRVIGDSTVMAVDARELHAFLGNRDHYATWIKDRISLYDFAEGVDFESFSEISEKGGRPRKEYALTIDMAKEVAMVDRSDKGREVRRYFIECERRVQQGAAPQIDVRNLAQVQNIALQLIEVNAEQREQIDRLEGELSETAGALDRIATAEGSLNITSAAKHLQIRPSDLFRYLREHRWIYKRPGGSANLGYQARITSGLLEHKVATILLADGTERVKEQVRITPKGLATLAKLLRPAVSDAGIAA